MNIFKILTRAGLVGIYLQAISGRFAAAGY